MTEIAVFNEQEGTLRMSIPKFTEVIEPDRPRPFRNSDTEADAKKMAAEIREIWASHGYVVETSVVQVSGRGNYCWAVRSDMINGMPRRKMDQAKAA